MSTINFNLLSLIVLTILYLFSLQGCRSEPKESPANPPNPKIGLLGKKNALSESLNGTWEFSQNGLLPDSENKVLGYLSLKDGQYNYSSVNKSPYRYAFIMQSKGNYELQYLPGINEATRLAELPGDTTIANINFEIFTKPGDLVIREFQISFKKEAGTLEFQTLLTGFQLWRIQKKI